MQRGQLKKQVLRGWSTWKLARHFEVGQTTIRYWLKKYGLKTNPITPKKAYWCQCGETDPKKFYGHKYRTCSYCQNQYNIIRGREKRKYIRRRLGDKCIICGFRKYKAALHAHHLDSTKKDPSFRQIRGWSYSRIDEEIKKCVLLCTNCHAAVHSNELSLSGISV